MRKDTITKRTEVYSKMVIESAHVLMEDGSDVTDAKYLAIKERVTSFDLLNLFMVQKTIFRASKIRLDLDALNRLLTFDNAQESDFFDCNLQTIDETFAVRSL